MAKSDREAPTFGRRATPVGGKDEIFEPAPPKPRKQKRQDDDFTSVPVDETPATNWRKAAPIAPGEEVKLVKVYKRGADINAPGKPKQPFTLPGLN